MTTCMRELPQDVLEQLGTMLGVGTLNHLRSTCTDWHQIFTPLAFSQISIDTGESLQNNIDPEPFWTQLTATSKTDDIPLTLQRPFVRGLQTLENLTSKELCRMNRPAVYFIRHFTIRNLGQRFAGRVAATHHIYITVAQTVVATVTKAVEGMDRLSVFRWDSNDQPTAELISALVSRPVLAEVHLDTILLKNERMWDNRSYNPPSPSLLAPILPFVKTFHAIIGSVDSEDVLIHVFQVTEDIEHAGITFSGISVGNTRPTPMLPPSTLGIIEWKPKPSKLTFNSCFPDVIGSFGFNCERLVSLHLTDCGTTMFLLSLPIINPPCLEELWVAYGGETNETINALDQALEHLARRPGGGLRTLSIAGQCSGLAHNAIFSQGDKLRVLRIQPADRPASQLDYWSAEDISSLRRACPGLEEIHVTIRAFGTGGGILAEIAEALNAFTQWQSLAYLALAIEPEPLQDIPIPVGVAMPIAAEPDTSKIIPFDQLFGEHNANIGEIVKILNPPFRMRLAIQQSHRYRYVHWESYVQYYAQTGTRAVYEIFRDQDWNLQFKEIRVDVPKPPNVRRCTHASCVGLEHTITGWANIGWYGFEDFCGYGDAN